MQAFELPLREEKSARRHLGCERMPDAANRQQHERQLAIHGIVRLSSIATQPYRGLNAGFTSVLPHFRDICWADAAAASPEFEHTLSENDQLSRRL
jgi:hypothetical protein